MGATALPRTLGLPDFPWDTLGDARQLAASHPGGIVDLSVGTPVDPTPTSAQVALTDHVNAPGYPLVAGTPQVRAAIRRWCDRRGMVTLGDNAVVPTTGSKEIVAWLPKLLGVGPGDTVLYPDVAYPTYQVSAVLAGATPVPVNQFAPDTWPTGGTFLWLNSPSNPTGQVATTEQLRAAVQWARQCGAVITADECYAELPWDIDRVPSLLDQDVCDGDTTGLLVTYSLSKQSNMAGYRGAFLAGDPTLIAAVIEARKHAGMMVPTPVQAAISAALDDHESVAQQRERYRRRRQWLLEAVTAAGLTPDPDTTAGLYLWLSAPDGMDLPGAPNRGRQLVQWFAQRGILVAPGDFYGAHSQDRVRMALTGSDERVEAACQRLKS